MFTETELNVRNKRIERLFRILFLLMTGLLILPVLIILATLVYKGGSVISIDFLFTAPTDGMTAGGIFPALLGTVWLVAVALLVSVPIGVAAAIYLSEYATDNWFTRIINLAIINLAGVPSIVHALFGVGAFVIFFGFGTSILAASLTLAIMTLPVVIVATKESLQAVPEAFREACWNMGATRWQTIRRVVLPNAVSGILTGVILEVSRTAGETAPIMFTGAAFFPHSCPRVCSTRPWPCPCTCSWWRPRCRAYRKTCPMAGQPRLPQHQRDSFGWCSVPQHPRCHSGDGNPRQWQQGPQLARGHARVRQARG